MTRREDHIGSDAVCVNMTLWHPNCWNIRVTEAADAGILGHGLYGTRNGRGYSRLTVYGDTIEDVETVIDRARAADDTFAVYEARHDYNGPAPGNATRDLLVERTVSNQVSSAFLSRGFVYADPIDIRDGVERWSVLTGHDRPRITAALDEIRAQYDAVIEVTSIREATEAGTRGTLPLRRLSERQREVFQLARRKGYYAWPRETSPEELAERLDITTSTFHEHLHKAEAKLLHDPVHEP